ncbi:unnamed protein product, partial [marine sediment metagenome]
AKKARAGVQMPGSEYDFIQGPIAETVVRDEPTAVITWKAGGANPAAKLFGRGIKQSIKLTGQHTVLATYQDGSPAVVQRRYGKGQVIYVASELEQDSLWDLLDWVYEQVGIERLVRVKTPDGKRIPGLESRTVHCKQGYLTYLYNMTEGAVTAKLHPTMSAESIEDLTYARTVEPTATFEVGPYDFYLLRWK